MADNGQDAGADAQAKAEAEAQAKADADAKADAKAEADKKGGGDDKVSKDEYEKLKEVEANKTKALADERKARQDAEAKLKAIDDEKAKAKEADLAKKGEYETIIKQKDEQIATLSQDVDKYKVFHDSAVEATTAENNKLLKEIPADEQEFVKDAIDGKDLVAQNKLLKNFAEKFKKPDFGKKAGEGESKVGDEKRKAEEEEAKKGGFKGMAGKIANDLFKRKE